MTTPATPRFNVIQIIADQHHAGLMRCAGHHQAITPNLDALAQHGVRFNAAYAQNTICTPSRVSILSGQYCHNHGYYSLGGPTPTNLPNFMGHFKSQGYRTAAFGKLHLPLQGNGNWLRNDVHLLADTYEDAQGNVGRSSYFTYLEALGLRDLEDSWHNPHNYGPGNMSLDATPSKLPYQHTQEIWCVNEAMKFIDNADVLASGKPNGLSLDQPFCMQLSLQKPHHPLTPQQQFLDMYPEDIALPDTYDLKPDHRPPHFQKEWEAMRQQTWDFAQDGDDKTAGARRVWRATLACVTQVDDVLGKLRTALETRGLWENTIIVYHADHGCYHGLHGIVEKAPGICSDAVCRVPMLWRVPDALTTPCENAHAVGRVVSQLVENVDVAVTLTSLCGLPPMPTADGCDLSSLLCPATNADGSLVPDVPVREVAVTENRMSKALRFGDWRFVHYPEEMFDGKDVGELYNLAVDPDERVNLYHDAAHQQLVNQCRRKLTDWLIRTTKVTTPKLPLVKRTATPTLTDTDRGRVNYL